LRRTLLIGRLLLDLQKSMLKAKENEAVDRMDLPKEYGEGDVTRARDAAVSGGSQTAAQFLPLVYDELLRFAGARMGRARPGETLTPTELVHEAYLRMAGGQTSCFEGRRHFFFSASRAMRDIAVESTRRKLSLKRGGDYLRVELEETEIASATSRESLIDLDRALAKLKCERPDRAQVVQLRYFGGLTEAKIAVAMGLSLATVKRRLRYVHAWLLGELSRPAPAA
jgi:RNA polymerase sigma factor (TIGR02999 family)